MMVSCIVTYYASDCRIEFNLVQLCVYSEIMQPVAQFGRGLHTDTALPMSTQLSICCEIVFNEFELFLV